MQLPQLWLDVLARVQTEFPEAVIAGGCLRDLIAGKPVKDVDIFVSARGDNTTQLLSEVLNEDMELVDVQITQYALHFSDLYGAYQPVNFGGGDHESDPFSFDLGTPFQLIALNLPVTLESCLARFDLGICKVATDGKNELIHPDFLHDLTHACMTLRAPATAAQIERSRKRHERLEQKYQGWPFVIPNSLDVV